MPPRPAPCNLTYDVAHNYAWDADGNLNKLDSGAAMVYDALGRRVEQPSAGGTAEILYGPDGSKLAVMAGQTVTRAFLGLPGGATAVYNSSGLAWYRHPDWLGSSRLASTPTPRTMYYDGAYSPMGEIIAQAGTADRNFTGQNQDLNPGGDLYDFPYREYHASHGRWISPDPAGLAAVNPANPQSWNRYAYVNGSPLNSVDPLGLDDCQPGGACADHAQQTQMPWMASGNVYNISLIGAGDVWFVNPYSGSTVTKVVTPGPNGDGFTVSWVSSVDLTVLISGGAASTRWPGPKTFIRMPLPSNALSCTTSTGVNFNAPPGFSVSDIAANGQTKGLLGALDAVGQGGYYDFQRFQVGSTTEYFSGYTPVANIAVGAYLQGAGVPQWTGSAISNTYAFFSSSNGATAQQAQFRNLGFSLASGEVTYSCQSHP